uniref:Pyroglutamyl-peptidase 1 n=1 Tax=Heterorhabditis bacteriophora TaxID=37862 RepID=A0A1I7XP69_HETBA
MPQSTPVEAPRPGCVPRDNRCPGTKSPVLRSNINCQDIAKRVEKQLGCGALHIKQSEDPGRYLCAFSYYISLSHDVSRTLFIHIPPFDEECSLETLTMVVQLIIMCILGIA